MIVSSRPRAARTGQYAAMFAYMLFLAFPLLWLLSISFKGARELYELHPTLVPHQPTLDSYRVAFTENGLLHAALQSFKVATATALITTAIALPAAYVLARQKGIISKAGLGWILLSQMFPLILIIIPLFLLLRDLHLADSQMGLVFVYVVWTLPFILWMLQSYVRGIPRDLEEAAMVDGAGRLTVLRTVIAPLLAPGVVVTALFAFITAWNEFFLALVLLQSPKLTTLPLLLARFVGVEGIVRLGPLAASALLATLPSLLLFTIIQRWLTRGLMSGAVKG
jgi:multiple sugar transport system permease protein